MDRRGRATARAILADLLGLQGDVAQAARVAAEVRAFHEASGQPAGLLDAALLVGALHERGGDLDAADDALRDAAERAERLALPAGRARARVLLARVALRRQDLVAAQAHLALARALWSRFPAPGPLTEVTALEALAAGRVDRAREAAGGARTLELPLVEALALRVEHVVTGGGAALMGAEALEAALGAAPVLRR